MTPAQSLTRAIRDTLALDRWVTFKCAAGMVKTGNGRMVVYGTAGAPDLVAVKGQRYILIEVKAGKDRLQPSQIAFRQDVERVFGNYVVARSVLDVVNFIEGK
jgi:hypothetical protein